MQFLSSPNSVPAAPLAGVLLRVGSVIFVVESLIMSGIPLFYPEGHHWQHVFLDAFILTVVVGVVVQRWVIDPLNTQLTHTMAQWNEAKCSAERLAQTDPLTGVLNRREFFNRFEREWLIAARRCTPLSFVMLDIDFFKRLNDTYGHMAGDAILKQLHF